MHNGETEGSKLYRYTFVQYKRDSENDQRAERKLRIVNGACKIGSELNAEEEAVLVVRVRYTRQKVIDFKNVCCRRQIPLLMDNQFSLPAERESFVQRKWLKVYRARFSIPGGLL